MPPGHNNHILNTRGDCFFNDILNNRLIDNRQHFLRHRFGRGKKPSSESCGWDHNFPDFLHTYSSRWDVYVSYVVSTSMSLKKIAILFVSGNPFLMISEGNAGLRNHKKR